MYNNYMSGKTKWKVISTKILFENSDIKVVSDKVLLPDGKITHYTYTPSTNDSVIMLVLDTKNNILLQQEYSHPPREIMWQLPGGSMKDNETVIEAAHRELAEESGYGAQSYEKIGQFYTNNRNSNRIQYVVLCSDIYPRSLRPDYDEFIKSTWVSLSKVKKMIKSGDFVNINLLASLNILFQNTNN